ncbi:golgi apyrase, partial [Tremellales sp. Uapishka_1]
MPPPAIARLSTHYALVVDAGSSGSRLQVYSWRDPDLERAEIVQEVRGARGTSSAKSKWWWKGKGKEKEAAGEKKALRRLVRVGKGVEGEDWVKRVEPGISTVSPSDISDYLSPLLTHALQHIPPSQHAHTPIYVLATAGMRLLPSDESDAILAATCRVLRQDYPFQVGEPSSAGPCGEHVRIISGEEEGMWGWVAVNYLMDGFGHAPSPSSTEGLLPLATLADAPSDSLSDAVTPVDVNHHSPTFGFLDMGGASTQLAFSPTPSEISRSDYPPSELRTVELTLLSGEIVQWPVFVASWLGFGTNRVRERYVERLIAQWRKVNELSDVSLSTAIPDPCLPVDLVISSGSPTHPSLIGTGSFDTCLEQLKPLLDHGKPCPTNHCLFAGLPTPFIDFEREDQRGFIGISEYWYTAHQVLGLGGVWDWAEWERGMNGFCGRNWGDVESEIEKEKGWKGAEVDLARLQLQCFKGAWISNVLHEGIGIPRLGDVGGNHTLTGGDVGETNEEAERRAREKGLLEEHSKGKTKTHFQSMDEVGETAISWTLGKMVIEASKRAESSSRAGAGVGAGWDYGYPSIAMEGVRNLGVQTIWAYSAASISGGGARPAAGGGNRPSRRKMSGSG